MDKSDKCRVCGGQKLLQIENQRLDSSGVITILGRKIITPSELMNYTDWGYIENVYCDTCGLIYHENTLPQWDEYLKTVNGMNIWEKGLEHG